MKKISTLLLFIIAVSINNESFAQTASGAKGVTEQTAPLPLQIFASNKGTLIQALMNKPFSPGSRFAFEGEAEYYGTYKNEMGGNQYMIQTFFTMDIVGNFALMGGSLLNDANGFGPTLGLQYSYFAKDFTFIALPRLEYLRQLNFELFTYFEYTPRLNDKWRIFAAVETVYNRDIKHNELGIAYTRPRLGLSRNSYQFGLGGNLSSYGPDKIKENLWGIFLRKEFY